MPLLACSWALKTLLAQMVQALRARRPCCHLMSVHEQASTTNARCIYHACFAGLRSNLSCLY